MGEDELRRELAYYKRHLDELAAQRISIEHHQWTLQMQVRQKKQGFQLLSRLARSLGDQIEPDSMFRIAVLAINSALDMDRTVIFVPGAQPTHFVAAHVAGLSEEEAARLGETTFEIPAEITAAVEPILIDGTSAETPSIARLREVLALESFVCASVFADHEPIGIILSGRLTGHATLFRALDHGDLDTFRAISGILQAVTQHTRLARLEQTERLKAEFYADVAHEFRTPLTLTLGPLAQILAGKWGGVPEPVRDRLQVVERNQGRLLGLINEILDIARLEAGAAELRTETIADVNELVAECVAHFRPAAEARGLELGASLDPRLDRRPLLADREKLERALFNLLSNALKFTDRGRIDLATRDDGNTLTVVIADTGRGIDEEDLPHVFDRFRRATGPAQRDAHGSGIGLALVKQMAELHQGEVTVTSRKGQGARFTLRIPLWEGVPGSDPARSPRSSAEAPLDVSLGGGERAADGDVEPSNLRAEARFDPAKPIVLYVEDDTDLRAYVRDTLADAYNLFLAVDGEDGLRCARRYRPDAIVTDQMMPRLDGQGFLLALREDPELRATPVVFLTAQYGMEGRVESLDAGADDYLSKPFHEAELRARIRNLIRARVHERELAELNRRLHMQVREQMAALADAGELEQFLPRAVVAKLRRAPDGARALPVRRPVVVLVTELTALAAFGDRLDEPVVAVIVNDYLGAISTICAAHGGVVDGLAGGRVSVLFGAIDGVAPVAAAWAAVETAAELREKMLQLNADARRRGLAHDGRRGIGIASGTCVFGAFGNDTLRAYTAIGEASQIAARLQSGATPGTIVCDEATRALLGERVRSRPHGERHELVTILPPASAAPAGVPPTLPTEHVPVADRRFRREGEYWTIRYNGRVFRLRSSKGIDYLSHLLGRPHVDMHVLELINASSSSHDPDRRALSAHEAAALGLSAVEGNAAAPILDQRAKREYRERLDELEEQLRTATSLGNADRASRVELEKTALARELATALGLGGRDRKPSATAERFRINVTRAIKAVLIKITAASPDLGRHLAASIRTGMFCTYAPQPGLPDNWIVLP
ncbi:hypothetical protein BH11MYX4_BH11MYX4_01650 [soil metagenome]